MNIRIGTINLVCVLLLSAGYAQSQPRIPMPGGGGGGPAPAPQSSGEVIMGTTPELTMRMVKEAGYSDVEIYTSKNNSKHVSGKINNILVSMVHNCRGDVCQRVTFLVNFGKQASIDLNWINAFNLDTCCAKAYIFPDESMWLNYSITFYGGTTPQFIKEHAGFFGVLLKRITEFNPKKG